MKIIDLTQPIYSGMPVYPGDPGVEVKTVQTIDKEGWDLQTLYLGTHLGTHVNVPSHMVKGGKTLEEFPLERFCGKAIIFSDQWLGISGQWTRESRGIIFRKQNIDSQIAGWIVANKAKILFVGLAAEHEFDIEIEKELLEHEIISFENLVNTDQLPDSAQGSFMFYGLPLKIKDGNGSPVRAIGVI